MNEARYNANLTEGQKLEIVKMVVERMKAEYDIMPKDYSYSHQFKMSVLEKVVVFVCSEVGCSIDELKKKYRKVPEHIIWARKLVWFLSRKFFSKHLSLETIGKYFGNDHANVIFHLKNLERELEVYGELRDKIDSISKLFTFEFEREIDMGKKVLAALKSYQPATEEIKEYLNNKLT